MLGTERKSALRTMVEGTDSELPTAAEILALLMKLRVKKGGEHTRVVLLDRPDFKWEASFWESDSENRDTHPYALSVDRWDGSKRQRRTMPLLRSQTFTKGKSMWARDNSHQVKEAVLKDVAAVLAREMAKTAASMAGAK